MNKIQRRPKLTATTATDSNGNGNVNNSNSNSNRGGVNRGGGVINQVGLFESCFNLVVSPSLDSYWADCLRYVCSVEKRSQYRTSSNYVNTNNKRNSSVAVVQVSQPNLHHHHLPGLMSTSSGSRLANTRQQKPRVVLSFLRWEQRDRDMRPLLAQVLRSDAHFAEGHVLNAIEADAGEEMGEPLIWYPVAHVRGLSLPGGGGGSVSMQQQHNTTQPLQLQQQQQRLERRVIGGHFTLIQGNE
ncbi:hypothetical protein Pmani_031835 [Petrolisthes manimaculis]|uniref:Uncharacterized protein n=1 Tax=Petrolisthes manimaculis TaxID=1843537 RepID=A0AAE1NSX8_9EUCA|nr:hypothetical protein Pmani_031835 [Petrolisthes manimaculis]